ncbi:hypothetical protein GCM10007919_71090 [Rhizobium indigoferae]|nr:hypothetical protein GCM10007919_71090 [Rhizobium indigoferae]
MRPDTRGDDGETVGQPFEHGHCQTFGVRRQDQYICTRTQGSRLTGVKPAGHFYQICKRHGVSLTAIILNRSVACKYSPPLEFFHDRVAQRQQKLSDPLAFTQPAKEYDQRYLTDANIVRPRVGDAIMGNDRAVLVNAQKCRQRHAIALAERHNAIGILKHPTYEPLLARRALRKVAGIVVIMQVQYVATPEQTGSLGQDQFSGGAAAAGDMDMVNASGRNNPVLCHRQDGGEQACG